MDNAPSTNGHRKVLFLCSGNYYRSRFAEILFNHKAAAAGLAWRADSRAVNLPESRKYIRGPISPYCVEGLAQRGITMPVQIRFPIQIEETDLAGCDLAIAMKEAEHRQLLEKMFPAHCQRVEYWQIHDIDCAEPIQALALLETAVDSLMSRLANQPIMKK